jgi:hypothetical protein
MFDNFDMEADIQEQRMFFEEKQVRMVEALTNMEKGFPSLEDKQLIWSECGLSRNLFMSLRSVK